MERLGDLLNHSIPCKACEASGKIKEEACEACKGSGSVIDNRIADIVVRSNKALLSECLIQIYKVYDAKLEEAYNRGLADGRAEKDVKKD